MVFAASMEGIELHELPEVASELRKTRTAITNALQLALHRGGAPLDVRRVHAALDRINSLLGGRP